MKIANFEIHVLETGTFKLDGGAMFGTVPKPLWEKAIPPDEQNRIPMALRIVLVTDAKTSRKLLVDTGIGEKWATKMKGIYAIDHSKDDLEKSLKAHGLSRSDITDVILTHLHFDHAGGATSEVSPGQFEPSFPNAKYYLQKMNFDWATAPNSREAASYLPENFMPLMEKGRLILCDGEEDFRKKINWPGFDVFISSGHTVGLQCPIMTLGSETFFYPSDLIPTSHHVPLPWVMGYDIHVIKLLEEKEQICARAADGNWIFIYEHDPVRPATKIVKGKKYYEAGEDVRL